MALLWAAAVVVDLFRYPPLPHFGTVGQTGL